MGIFFFITLASCSTHFYENILRVSTQIDNWCLFLGHILVLMQVPKYNIKSYCFERFGVFYFYFGDLEFSLSFVYAIFRIYGITVRNKYIKMYLQW